MIKDIHAKQLSVQQRLAIICLVISSLVLFCSAFYEWYVYREQQARQIAAQAQQKVFQFDEFVEHLLQTNFALDFSHEQLRDCGNSLLPLLQGIIFNNPYIAAIAISDKKHQLRCSTTRLRIPQANQSSTPHMHGPVDPGGKNQPVYILQQQLGHYQFTLYILKNILDNLFQPMPSSAFTSILLYDSLHQTAILQVDKKLTVSPPGQHSNAIKIPSQTLNDYQFFFRPKAFTYDKRFIYTELILSISIIILSFIIYFVLRNLLNRRFSLQYALKNSLKNGDFEPIYQPVLDVSNNKCCGAEVLVRWQMATDTLIMPDLFIEEAEESGLIVPITRQLIEKTFHQCEKLLKQYPDFHLAFNVSVNHFSDTGFFPQLFKLCEQYAIAPKQIILELTERRLFDQKDVKNLQLIKAIRSKGFALAIDDFGTGHASINYLQHLPFNYLKIDKQFVQAIGTGAITETLNQAIINMARSLHLSIIAEGVETAEQFQYLHEQKIGFIQGWYYAKAMSAEQLLIFIQEESS